jgi:hypothetical protein
VSSRAAFPPALGAVGCGAAGIGVFAIGDLCIIKDCTLNYAKVTADDAIAGYERLLSSRALS